MARQRPTGAEAFEVPLWRALAVYRMAAWAYAAVLMAVNFRRYAHPGAGWLVIAVMAGWSVFTIYGYGRPGRGGWPLLVADLIVVVACLVVSPWVLGPAGRLLGIANVPVAWIAGPVLAWAISGGRRRGAVAALLVGGSDLVARGIASQILLTGTVLLLLAGIGVGHVARLSVQAQETLRRATRIEAATRERERLARSIHDSVLQVLAMVQHRGVELGGDAAELGRLAGEQEVALRALVGSAPAPEGAPGEPVDLRALLAPYASPLVSLATPAEPVELPPAAAGGLAAAVAAALSNVWRHCGPAAHAWVLVEDDAGAVTVSVRDDGPGIAAGRLDQAAVEGRLGVAQSIVGRIRDAGGTATITSAPGDGTEVELRIPRP